MLVFESAKDFTMLIFPYSLKSLEDHALRHFSEEINLGCEFSLKKYSGHLKSKYQAHSHNFLASVHQRECPTKVHQSWTCLN